MESPAGGLCGVPYHALNCASTACRYNSVGLNYITLPKCVTVSARQSCHGTECSNCAFSWF